jgi:hypothetical protein
MISDSADIKVPFIVLLKNSSQEDYLMARRWRYQGFCIGILLIFVMVTGLLISSLQMSNPAKKSFLFCITLAPLLWGIIVSLLCPSAYSEAVLNQFSIANKPFLYLPWLKWQYLRILFFMFIKGAIVIVPYLLIVYFFLQNLNYSWTPIVLWGLFASSDCGSYYIQGKNDAKQLLQLVR